MKVYKFQFYQKAKQEFIEEQIAIAILAVESIFGAAKVRLNAGYLAVDNQVIIDVSHQIGEYIAQVFTGLMIRFIGETNFTVKRIENERRKEKA